MQSIGITPTPLRNSQHLSLVSQKSNAVALSASAVTDTDTGQ